MKAVHDLLSDTCQCRSRSEQTRPRIPEVGIQRQSILKAAVIRCMVCESLLIPAHKDHASFGSSFSQCLNSTQSQVIPFNSLCRTEQHLRMMDGPERVSRDSENSAKVAPFRQAPWSQHWKHFRTKIRVEDDRRRCSRMAKTLYPRSN